MPELSFQVEGAETVRSAATPLLNCRLCINTAISSVRVANVILQCHIQIESPRRRYRPGEQERLRELFGDPLRFKQGPHPLLWTHNTLLIPGFEGSCIADLPVPCSYDFNVAAVKFFYALEDGEVPLLFQFSGTVFYRDENDRLQISRIAWTKEATFLLPDSVWQEMMDRYYPNGTWLCLDRDQFDRLYRYKRQHGLSTWEQALDSLLDIVEENVP
ncbi:DUF6084 family protein [Glaciimonas sp. GNP009]